MALSSEIEDLEQFIDSYVGPESRTSSSEWPQTNSFNENQTFGSLPHDKLAARSDTGTEYWGKQPDGPQWVAPEQTRQVHQQWNERRPKIQDRQAEQWQQPVPFPDQQPTSYSYANTSQWESNPAMSQMMASQAQGPNDIQAIVSNLIRQNNMTKGNQHAQLPPWVDITKPPPPLQGQMPQYEYQSDPYTNPMELQSREPILHSMTFQRSANDVMNPTQASPVHFAQRTATPEAPAHYPPEMQYSQHQQMPEMMHHGQSIYYQPQVMDSRGSPAGFSPQMQETNPGFAQQHVVSNTEASFPQTSQHIEGAYNMQMGQFGRQQAPPVHYEYRGYNPEQPMVQQQVRPSTEIQTNNTVIQQTDESRLHKPPPQQQPRNVPQINISESVLRQDKAKENEQAISKPPLDRKSSNEKYPNSMARLSESGQTRAAGESIKKNAERSYSEVFEDESDDRWRTHNFKVHLNSKKNTRRTSSAADDDPDWRRRDSGDSSQSRSNYSESDHRHSSSDNDRRNQKQNIPTPGKQNTENRQREKQQLHRKRSDADHSDNEGHRRVTAKGKSKVHSWLENGSNIGNSEQELRQLRISDSEADLTKFIETTQAFATNEAKMREVAEILCNKALKNPKFARNASILCDRMSWMMVQGTKFRSVVLNVMQGHYKNRDHLFSATFRSDRRWFGFAAFMVEIFFNVRTSSGDRLIVLNEPVFQCLLQVLKSDQVTKEHVECFGNLFARAGAALEKENPTRMSELLAEVRDRCVISKTSHTRRVLLSCIELYATKWQSGIN